jgi:sentrin-specific protease 7
MPSLKQAPASSPSRSPRRRPVLSSPPQPRPRSGSHDDPITLDDSQDLDAPMQQRARTTKKPPPEVIELDRSQESVTAPTRRSYAMTQSSPFQRKSRPQAVERDDSIQEVHDYEWREGRDITHAQRASLEDARRRRSQQSNSPLHEPDHPIDELYYGQRACLEPSHTLQGVSETQAMDLDNDDRVVSETPERQRSSPGANAGAMEWQAGSQLP